MMKKFLLFIFACTILLSGCDKEKAAIFFTSGAITPENFSVQKCQKVFNVGQRIDFLLYNPKPLTNSVIRIQVLKIDSNEFVSGFTIAHARDIEINTRLNYATDYFYLYQEGAYMLRIFSKSNLEKPIAEEGFYVR
jgi:hypothetical protein